MDVAKLNQEILGVDLEYKNVYIDAENTRMIRAKLPYGYCDLVRTDVLNGRVNHPEEHDIVKYTAISWYIALTLLSEAVKRGVNKKKYNIMINAKENG